MDNPNIITNTNGGGDCRDSEIFNNSTITSSNSAASSSRNYDNQKCRMLDITRDNPMKLAVRIVVPVKDHPKFNFVGKLLGPKGNSLKRLQEITMCKMAVLGRGSMRDKRKEEELRISGESKYSHLYEDLHVEISTFAIPAEAHARIALALNELRKFLVPILQPPIGWYLIGGLHINTLEPLQSFRGVPNAEDDYNDDIRQEQMLEMQLLTSQDASTASATDAPTTTVTSGDNNNCTNVTRQEQLIIGGKSSHVTSPNQYAHHLISGVQGHPTFPSGSVMLSNVIRKRQNLHQIHHVPQKRSVIALLTKGNNISFKPTIHTNYINQDPDAGIATINLI